MGVPVFAFVPLERGSGVCVAVGDRECECERAVGIREDDMCAVEGGFERLVATITIIYLFEKCDWFA